MPIHLPIAHGNFQGITAILICCNRDYMVHQVSDPLQEKLADLHREPSLFIIILNF